MDSLTRVVSAMVLTCAFACGEDKCPPGTMMGVGTCKVPEAGKAAPMAGSGAAAGTRPWPRFDDAGAGRGGSGGGNADASASVDDAGTDAAMVMTKTCGNGLLDPGEVCDFDCPTTCDTGNRCLVGELEGSAAECSAECKQTLVSECKGGDGCCPAGCDNAADSDCSVSCGNGKVETSETCDGDCPDSCDDGEACTVDMATGSSAQCSLVCMHEPAKASRTPDGCCPSGANVSIDPDCPQRCGDGVVTGNETCDQRSARRCPASCDDGNPCTMDLTEGDAAACTVRCRHEPLGAGASCGGDSRCDDSGECQAPRCGDGVVDPGERCDGNCPMTCSQMGRNPGQIECSPYVMVGDGCQRRCELMRKPVGTICEAGRGVGQGVCNADGGCIWNLWYQGCVADNGCFGALDCKESRGLCTVECVDDTPCGVSQTGAPGACISGFCQQPCQRTEDCRAGQMCMNLEGVQRCRPKPCAPNATSDTLRCPDGQVCLQTTGEDYVCVIQIQ